MKIRFLSSVMATGLGLCLSWPIMAQSSPKPGAVNSPDQRTSETVTEDTSSQQLKPTQTNEVPKTPNSTDGTQSTSETSPDSEIRIQELRNTTGEVEKQGSEAVESVESQTPEEVIPTDKKPETSVPNTIKK